MQSVKYTNANGEYLLITPLRQIPRQSNYVFSAIEGIGAPQVDTYTTTIPGEDGVVSVGSYVGPRTIKLKVHIVADNEAAMYQARRQLIASLSHFSGYGTFVYSNGAGEEYEISALLVNGPGAVSRIKNTIKDFELSFFCPFPHFKKVNSVHNLVEPALNWSDWETKQYTSTLYEYNSLLLTKEFVNESDTPSFLNIKFKQPTHTFGELIITGEQTGKRWVNPSSVIVVPYDSEVWDMEFQNNPYIPYGCMVNDYNVATNIFTVGSPPTAKPTLGVVALYMGNSEINIFKNSEGLQVQKADGSNAIGYLNPSYTTFASIPKGRWRVVVPLGYYNNPPPGWLNTDYDFLPMFEPDALELTFSEYVSGV